MREDTVLVSIMHVNNEISVIQDIGAIGELCRARKIIFHVDAAQSAGKIPLDVKRDESWAHLYVSAHSAYGPSVIGALCSVVTYSPWSVNTVAAMNVVVLHCYSPNRMGEARFTR